MKTFLSFTTGLLLGFLLMAVSVAFYNDDTKEKTKELVKVYDKAN